jgi:hypothetical protein
MDEDATPLHYSFVSLEGFLNAKVLVELLKRLGPNLDRGRIRQVMESIDRLDLGVDVPISFGPGKHQGMDRVYYTVVEAGRFVPVKDWGRWQR